jgi:hypothetical protein
VLIDKKTELIFRALSSVLFFCLFFQGKLRARIRLRLLFDLKICCAPLAELRCKIFCGGSGITARLFKAERLPISSPSKSALQSAGPFLGDGTGEHFFGGSPSAILILCHRWWPVHRFQPVHLTVELLQQ